MGSTPHAHAQADVKTLQEQGVIAMIGVFINSFAVITVKTIRKLIDKLEFYEEITYQKGME